MFPEVPFPLSCAVGFAVQEGLIDLNEKLTEAFSGDLPECIDENLKEATVREISSRREDGMTDRWFISASRYGKPLIIVTW